MVFHSALKPILRFTKKHTWYFSCMQCPLNFNTIMSLWMNTCSSFCLKTISFWVTPTPVFGYKTIHNFHCLWYNNSIWYTVCQCMSMSWFPIVQGRQQWTLFLCTGWDSLIHHIAFMSLPRKGLSREGVINETWGRLGEHKQWEMLNMTRSRWDHKGTWAAGTREG